MSGVERPEEGPSHREITWLISEDENSRLGLG